MTVWKLDRLGRSVRDLLNILHDLQKRGIQFESLTDAISTETPTGRAMLHMVALLAELESNLIAERTRASVKAAKAKGVKFGRKPKLSPAQIKHARQQIERGQPLQDVAAILNVSRITLYRALKD